ncbi:fumarylacetoacetase [Novosphingopyxis sp.]|uniref:fumarylacetoacetase n=1 Tax=Novosphingopyxis sp. TaxID=2709690 RepID=UPI003B5992F3
MTDSTHSPDLKSWVSSADRHADFPIQNLPLGIFSPKDEGPRAGTAIGDKVLDLWAVAELGLLPRADVVPLENPTLNAFFALPKADRMAFRQRLSELLSDEQYREKVEPLLYDAADCTMHLPARIGDYTDFYVGIHHAMNIGKQFRPDNPLLPNYKYVPIGYHGRASSIRVSGEPVTRPNGQRKAPDEDAPVRGPSRRLDYELELGVWIGPGNALGEPIAIADAPDHVAGFGLLNDWSARDLQGWEYQPLGPFLAKNFHSTVSPWVVTAEAMAPFRKAQAPRPEGDPAPLDYLSDAGDRKHGALALELDTFLLTAKMRDAGEAPHRLSQSAAEHMYWTVAQIVTHHASNGCDLRPGDLLGTGTISGPNDDSLGSLMEMSKGGKEPITLPNGETRGFLEDGDEIILKATAKADGAVPIGFGECRAVVRPAP